MQAYRVGPRSHLIDIDNRRSQRREQEADALQPLLLLALEEYFTSPTDDVLRRLFDTCNEIPTDGMPRFSKYEKILLRSSERKDLFREKYARLIRDGADDTLTGPSRKESFGSEAEPAIIQSVFDRDRDREKRNPSEKELRTIPKDTHWFETRVEFRNIKVPIRIPMTTFDEDVGEVHGSR